MAVSKKFLTDVIAGMPASQAGRVAADVIAAIKREILETGRFTLPDFGSFAVRETKGADRAQPAYRRKDQGKGRRDGEVQGQPEPEEGRAGRSEEGEAEGGERLITGSS